MSRNLRIAVFTYEFPALSETFVLGQITGLLDLGHDVRIFAVRRRDEPFDHPDVDRYGLLTRTRYLGLPERWLTRGWNAAGISLRMAMSDRQALARCLNVRRHGRIAASARLLYWRECLAGSEMFDVILAHFGPVGEVAARLRDAGLIAGRLATVMHGVDVSAELVDRPGRYRRLFESGELFLPVSRVWRDRLIEVGCDPRRVAVHHMGVDTTRFRFRPRHKVPGQPVRLLTIGRLIEKKGVEFALRAVADLVRNGVDLRYRVVGDGPMRFGLERLAELLGIGEIVEFQGWRDQASISELIDDSDILLAPSVTTRDGDQEGIPVTLMEAMASGMPVVATRHSGIPELVDDGCSGLLVAERDCDELVVALNRLIGAPATWPAMSKAARQKIIDEFNLASLNGALVERFDALLAEPAGTTQLIEGETPAPAKKVTPKRFVGPATGSPSSVP
jgi:colanic acid/amylovoran biosynthesis glycosyltransferase